MNEFRAKFTPTTGEEVALLSGARIKTYRDLVTEAEVKGDRQAILDLGPATVILIEDPRFPRVGHWVCIKVLEKERKVFFFSSYGGKPDQEKNQWFSRSSLAMNGQARNVLNDGLFRLAQEGWEIHYSEFPFQRIGDGTASCGIWASAFLRSDLNPTKFGRLMKRTRATPGSLLAFLSNE